MNVDWLFLAPLSDFGVFFNVDLRNYSLDLGCLKSNNKILVSFKSFHVVISRLHCFLSNAKMNANISPLHPFYYLNRLNFLPTAFIIHQHKFR